MSESKTAVPDAFVAEAGLASGVDAVACGRLRAAVTDDIERRRHYGAVVLLARRGRVILHEAFGLADSVTGRAAATTDRFMTASMGKAFTAALVLTLIDRGALAFDTPVSAVIPEYAVRGKAPTTVGQLLNHTGGVYAGFAPPPPLTWADTFDLKKYVAGVAAQQVLAEPGSQVYYSPFAGHAVLGEIAQRVSGRSFAELMAEEIFTPLGMNKTSTGLVLDHPDRVPVRMTDHNPGATTADIQESFNHLLDENAAIPSGGFFTTAMDVYRFAEFQRRKGALGGSRVLSQTMVEYGLKNSTGERPNVFWDFSRIDRKIPFFPANMSRFGGYVRGEGHYLTPLGQTASAGTFGAVGSGSTMYMVDPERELTFVFLGAGLSEGLGHFEDMSRLNDLALATCTSIEFDGQPLHNSA
ncbi:serine hydrolase domain-containing protein [Streptomyces sp. NPDC091217]|uniref:serine hydrolase domain-containing protein n=1 Tax=Streptomyces sp. NPDC091217 TaxID=3365975 RepID=UPI0037F89D59